VLLKRRATLPRRVGMSRPWTTLYRDLSALALLALTVFLGLALLTYDAADRAAPVAPFHLLHQPDALVYPPNVRTSNVCGTWGAIAADTLFTWFGVGAYYLVV